MGESYFMLGQHFNMTFNQRRFYMAQDWLFRAYSRFAMNSSFAVIETELQSDGTDYQPPLLADASIIAYFAAFCFGVGDSTFNTQVTAI